MRFLERPYPLAFVVAIVLLSQASGTGCSRTYYRNFADRQIYDIQKERELDPRWDVRLRPVEPDPRARFCDPHDPDAVPTPLDDPFAYGFQVSERMSGLQSFAPVIRDRGVAPIEDRSWLMGLPRSEKGEVLLSEETVMQLAVIHGRDYQFQIEQLYLAALAVNLERFRFQVQPFYNQALDYQYSGSPANDSSQLIPVARAGLTKNFYSGAQLLVEFANNLLFEYSGDGFSTVGSSLLISMTQPLLRGAFARIVTQQLSLQERGMLYAIREFARFRRALYVNVVASGGYLGLLQQLQAIRNAQENLISLKRNLDETEALVAANFKSLSERDQVALSYQQAQLALLSQEANLETSLDAYRIQLGLPPDLDVALDDSPLDIFELNDTKLEALRDANDSLYLSLLQTETSPPRETLLSAIAQLQANQRQLQAALKTARGELDRWREDIGLIDELGERPLLEPPEDASEAQKFEYNLAVRLNTTLIQTEEDFEKDIAQTQALADLVANAPPDALEEPWKELRSRVGDNFRSRLSDVFVTQTLARVYLIELIPIPLTLEQAIAVALCNRQDLMNAQAQVADAWRNVEVAANALQADLDITGTANLATDPNFDGIFRFDASASLYRFGFRFDAPIVRRAERNAYRAAQIAYQRERRQWMFTRDEVVRQIRLDLRNLELASRQFDIGREQLVTSARAVQENEINLRSSREPNAGLTLLLLTALNNLLGAKNGLIGNWVQYETSRLSLYRDLDIMDIDANGVWTNERIDPSVFESAPPSALYGTGGAGLLAVPDTFEPAREELQLPPLP